MTTGENASALIGGIFHEFLNPGQLGCAGQRTDVELEVVRLADLVGLNNFNQLGFEVGLEFFGNIDPRECNAELPAVAERSRGDNCRGPLDVCRRQNDRRVLATELKRGADESGSRALSNVTTGCGRTGECNVVDVVGNRVANLGTVADDNAPNVFWQTNLNGKSTGE